MTSRGLAAALFLVAGYALASTVQAQEAAAPADPAATSSSAPLTDWTKVCEPLDGGKRACIIRRVAMNADGKAMGLFVLRNNPGDDNRLVAVAAVPLGVMLPFNVVWQIDNNEPFKTSFTYCDPKSCSTQTPVNELFVNALKKGSKLTLTVRSPDNQLIVVPVDLKGFTAAYDSPDAMTAEEFNKVASGQAAIEQTLRERQEQARQALESSQEPAN